tara:strand:- start:269 stop:712 length:444 start_codon:yes stop_codon:yes gene_type:complete
MWIERFEAEFGSEFCLYESSAERIDSKGFFNPTIYRIYNIDRYGRVVLERNCILSKRGWERAFETWSEDLRRCARRAPDSAAQRGLNSLDWWQDDHDYTEYFPESPEVRSLVEEASRAAARVQSIQKELQELARQDFLQVITQKRSV